MLVHFLGACVRFLLALVRARFAFGLEVESEILGEVALFVLIRPVEEEAEEVVESPELVEAGILSAVVAPNLQAQEGTLDPVDSSLALVGILKLAEAGILSAVVAPNFQAQAGTLDLVDSSPAQGGILKLVGSPSLVPEEIPLVALEVVESPSLAH
jgi:hypothetical protein